MLSQRIKEERLRIGLSQEELGKKLSVSQQAVNKWENSKSNPDSEMIRKMADLFDCTIDYLVGRTDDPTPLALAAHRSDDPLSELPPEARKSLEEFQDYILRKYGLKKDT
jgi:transcriptional regulator with XRE-family HTH domain